MLQQLLIKVKRINEKETTENDNQQNNNTESENQLKTEERSTIFERFTQSLKTFLDNAE